MNITESRLRKLAGLKEKKYSFDILEIKKIAETDSIMIIESDSSRVDIIDRDTFLGTDEYDRKVTEIDYDLDHDDEDEEKNTEDSYYFSTNTRDKIIKVLKNNDDADNMSDAKKKGFEFRGHIQYNHKKLYSLLGDVTFSYGATYSHFPKEGDTEGVITDLHHDHHEWRLEITIRNENGRKEVVPIILFDWEDEGPIEIVRNSEFFNWSILSPHENASDILYSALGKLRDREIQLDVQNGETEPLPDNNMPEVVENKRYAAFKQMARTSEQKRDKAAQDRFHSKNQTPKQKYRRMKRKQKNISRLAGEK